MYEWKNAGRNGPAQIFLIHTNQRQNISIGSEDQTGTSTLIPDKDSNALKKQSHQFSYKD